MHYIFIVSRMSLKQRQVGEDRPEFCDECGLLWNSLWCCPTGDPEGPQTYQIAFPSQQHRRDALKHNTEEAVLKVKKASFNIVWILRR